MAVLSLSERDPCECHDELGDILRKTEVRFLALSWIVQTLWDLCECQVIIEARVPLFVFLIKMDAN